MTQVHNQKNSKLFMRTQNLGCHCLCKLVVKSSSFDYHKTSLGIKTSTGNDR